MAFQSFDFERTWWRLFQKCVVHIKFDIYVFINEILVCNIYLFYVKYMYSISPSLTGRLHERSPLFSGHSHQKSPLLKISGHSQQRSPLFIRQLPTKVTTLTRSLPTKVTPLTRSLPPKVTPVFRPLPPNGTPLFRPSQQRSLPPKVTPVIRPDFRCTEIVKYCLIEIPYTGKKKFG